MWGAKPETMCRQHLLGEHLELHMFAGTLKKKGGLKGYITNNLLDVKEIKNRHDAIAEEMRSRGFNHKTPMESNPNYDYLPEELQERRLNKLASAKDLRDRCDECRRKWRQKDNPTSER